MGNLLQSAISLVVVVVVVTFFSFGGVARGGAQLLDLRRVRALGGGALVTVIRRF